MNTQQAIGAAVAAMGIVLLILGLNATHSLGEKVVEGVTGHYTDQTQWYLIGGVAALIGGAVLAFASGGRRTV